MRYSLLAGGKRIRPVLALATAEALGRDRRRGAAARGGDRDDPHLLADPRRPAGDGRRRPAPRQADLPRRLRRGRGDPGRRRAVRRGAAAGARPSSSGEPANVLAAVARARRRGRASAAWSAGSTSTSPATPTSSCATCTSSRPGALIAASVGCVLALEGLSGPATIPFRRFAAELGVVFQIVDDILDVTGDEAELGKPQRLRRAPRQGDVRERVRARAGPGARRASRTQGPRGAGRGRRATPARLGQIADYILTRTT